MNHILTKTLMAVDNKVNPIRSETCQLGYHVPIAGLFCSRQITIRLRSSTPKAFRARTNANCRAFKLEDRFGPVNKAYIAQYNFADHFVGVHLRRSSSSGLHRRYLSMGVRPAKYGIRWPHAGNQVCGQISIGCSI